MENLVCWVAHGEDETKWASAIKRSTLFEGISTELRRLPLRTSKGFQYMSPNLLAVLAAESPDLILHDEAKDRVLMAVEVSRHNPMGANAFQRIARLATAAQMGVPAVLVSPSRKWVNRQEGRSDWQELSPVFFALLRRINRTAPAPIVYVDPSMGAAVGLKGFAAAILGGLGSIPGAIVGGLVFGVLEAVSAGYISSSYTPAIAFIVMMVVLMAKPSGIVGEVTVEKV
jgi:hypothetical protein